MAQLSCPPSTRDVGEQYPLSAPTDTLGRDLHRPALSQTPSLCTCVRLTFVTAPTRRTMARDVPQFELPSIHASLAEANSAHLAASRDIPVLACCFDPDIRSKPILGVGMPDYA